VEFQSISQEFHRYRCPAGESNTLWLISPWLEPFEIDSAISFSQIRRPRIKQSSCNSVEIKLNGHPYPLILRPILSYQTYIFLVVKLPHNDLFYVITAFMCYMGFILVKGFHKQLIITKPLPSRLLRLSSVFYFFEIVL